MTARVIRELREGPGMALSCRELDVLELVAAGLSNKEVAERLGVSPGTVTVYVSRLVQKLHLKNRAEVIGYAVRPNRTRPPWRPVSRR